MTLLEGALDLVARARRCGEWPSSKLARAVFQTLGDSDYRICWGRANELHWTANPAALERRMNMPNRTS